jgi:hypothetical protein
VEFIRSSHPEKRHPLKIEDAQSAKFQSVA